MWDFRPWCLSCDCCNGPLLVSGILGEVIEVGIEVGDVEEQDMTCRSTVIPIMGPLYAMVWMKGWGVWKVEDIEVGLEVGDFEEEVMTCRGTVVPIMGPLYAMVWMKGRRIGKVEDGST